MPAGQRRANLLHHLLRILDVLRTHGRKWLSADDPASDVRFPAGQLPLGMELKPRAKRSRHHPRSPCLAIAPRPCHTTRHAHGTVVSCLLRSSSSPCVTLVGAAFHKRIDELRVHWLFRYIALVMIGSILMSILSFAVSVGRIGSELDRQSHEHDTILAESA